MGTMERKKKCFQKKKKLEQTQKRYKKEPHGQPANKEDIERR
jgi:hypothetical protein